jgi:hypothetical protein
MPQEEVEEAEKEAALLYIINDPTLAAGPKAVLTDLREERLLELQNPGMGMATTGRGRKAGAKKGGKPSSNTSPSKLRGSESPTGKGRPGPDAPVKKPEGKAATTTDKAGGAATQKMTTTKKVEVGEGSKTPLPKPVLDGRRLPDNERLPKELEMRERELREGTGPYPPPMLHTTQKEGDDDGEAETEESA